MPTWIVFKTVMAMLAMIYLGLFKIRKVFLPAPHQPLRPPKSSTNFVFIQKEYIEVVLKTCDTMVGVVRETEQHKPSSWGLDGFQREMWRKVSKINKYKC